MTDPVGSVVRTDGRTDGRTGTDGRGRTDGRHVRARAQSVMVCTVSHLMSLYAHTHSPVRIQPHILVIPVNQLAGGWRPCAHAPSGQEPEVPDTVRRAGVQCDSRVGRGAGIERRRIGVECMYMACTFTLYSMCGAGNKKSWSQTYYTYLLLVTCSSGSQRVQQVVQPGRLGGGFRSRAEAYRLARRVPRRACWDTVRCSPPPLPLPSPAPSPK